MFFVLSLVEGILGHTNTMEGSTRVAEISFVLAVGLLVLSHRVQERKGAMRMDRKSSS